MTLGPSVGENLLDWLVGPTARTRRRGRAFGQCRHVHDREDSYERRGLTDHAPSLRSDVGWSFSHDFYYRDVSHRILRVFTPVGRIDAKTYRLTNDSVEHFSEYDAIVLAPTWADMFGGDAQEPGTAKKLKYESWRGREPIDYFGWYLGELSRRGAELEAFFGLGGLLVIRITGDLRLQAPGHLSGEVSAQAWLTDPLLRGLVLAGAPLDVSAPSITLPGSGSIAAIDPGHTFEGYLRSVGSYDCRLNPGLRALADVTVLAENRAGDPVAIESEALAGSIVLIPPPRTEVHEKLLEMTVARALDQRITVHELVTLDAERDLLRARDEAVKQQRKIRIDADMALAQIRAQKTELLKEEVVKRAIDYLLSATRLSATPEKALGRLYKMWEMLEEYCGGSEGKLADALRMPLERIKRIKRIANDPELDLRHSTAAGLKPPAASQVAEAIEIGREMVVRFVELRYTQRARAPKP